MTMITYGRESSRRAGMRFVPGFLDSVSSRVSGYVRRSQAERHLEQLDDRLLADIGLKRSDIQKMVWGS
jgi:uncharacterized protein YjiS (DUF1127 family)